MHVGALPGDVQLTIAIGAVRASIAASAMHHSISLLATLGTTMNHIRTVFTAAITSMIVSVSVILIFRYYFPAESARTMDVIKALDVRAWDIDSIDGSQFGVRLVGPDGVINSSGMIAFAPGESKRLVMLSEPGGVKRFCIYTKSASGTFNLSVPSKYDIAANNIERSIKPGAHLVKYGINSESASDKISAGEAALVLFSE